MNELRFYIMQMLSVMETPSDEEKAEGHEPFKPSYLVTAVKLPTGAIELAVNTEKITEKLEYILEAYDDEMRLKINPEVSMQNLMVV